MPRTHTNSDNHRQAQVESARLQQENQALYRELGPLLALQDLVGRLAEPAATAELATALLRAALTRLAGRTAVLAVAGPDGTLTFTAAEGDEADALRGQPFPSGHGVLPWVSERRRPAVVDSEDPRVAPFERTFSPEGLIAAVPLVAAGERVGILAVFAVPHCDDRQRAWLESTGATIAARIEIDRLRTELRNERRQGLASLEELRRKLARDLHDGPAQQLAALTMNLEIIARLLSRDPTSVTSEFGAAISLARRTNRGIRTLLFELRPLMLEAQGLVPALQLYLDQFQPGGVAFHLTASKSVGRCAADVEATLFAVAQEAIANVRKHAQAHNCWVGVTRRAGQITLTIRDDGRGFDVETVQRTYARLGSLGLVSMRERIELAGGTFAIESALGEGTTVTARVRLVAREVTRSSSMEANAQ